MKRRNASLLTGMLALMLTFWIVIFSFSLLALYAPQPTKVEIEVKENKPSYDYLKSITVEIYGEAVVEKDIYMCYEEDMVGAVERLPSTEKVGWGGTGVVIKEEAGYTYILTNAHVAGDGKDSAMIYVQNGNKKQLTEVYKVHELLDMAILKVEGRIKYKNPVKGFAVAKPQDKAYMVGHHLGRPYIYGEGVFAGYDGINALIQIPSIYGNSGSGVIDKDGNLIALVYAGSMINFFQIDNTHALAIDGECIKLYLEKLNLI